MDTTTADITPRQRQFLINYAFEGMPAGRAYARAYNRPVDNTAYVEGHHLLRKPKILAGLEYVQLVAMQNALELLEKQKQLLDDPEVPAIMKFKLLNEVLNGKYFRVFGREIVIRETCPKCAKQDERLRHERHLLDRITAIQKKLGV